MRWTKVLLICCYKTDTDDDSIHIAKDAFVVTLLAVIRRRKLCVALFMLDGIIENQRANIVIQTVDMTDKITAHIASTACDGAAA